MIPGKTVKNPGRVGKSRTSKDIQTAGKQGKASNRRGIRYGSREAGRGAEHFEPHKRGEPHSHGSRKSHPVTGPRRKTKEQRIVSG